MQYEQVRGMLLRQWEYTGGPNEAKASELYHDDVILEFPQSGEWFRGKANQQGWRERYPAKLDFQPREIRGSGDLWIAEGVLSYDGSNQLHYVKIIQFRGDRSSARRCTSRSPLRRPSGAGRGRRPVRRLGGRATCPSMSTGEADRHSVRLVA